MDHIDALTQYGLTRQEANLYLLLLSEGSLTGYEASKQTGISRSNTYSGLAGLVDKGAAYVEEGAVTRYSPVKAEEFCGNKIRFLETLKQELAASLPERKESEEGYLTIRGERHILDKMISMLQQTKLRVYLAVSSNVLSLLEPELTDAAGRNIKTVILSDERPQIAGVIYYPSRCQKNQIRMITDSQNVLTGELNGELSTCLYSGRKNLADVFKEALRNEIKLIELTKSEKEEDSIQ